MSEQPNRTQPGQDRPDVEQPDVEQPERRAETDDPQPGTEPQPA